jgi:hypothetical protein
VRQVIQVNAVAPLADLRSPVPIRIKIESLQESEGASVQASLYARLLDSSR